VKSQTSTAKKNASGQVRLTEDEQKELTRDFLEEGDDAVARRYGLAKGTLARAALGAPIQVGTAAVIRAGLTGQRYTT
jgi:hypothetical protein